MGVSLRALIVEDSAPDTMLLVAELRQTGFDLTYSHVETAEELREALHTSEWDLVLTDFSLPTLTAPDVLEIVTATGRDIPCIVVSGTMGEEAAVDVLKSGAVDFVVKNRLGRLGPAIRRELREIAERRKRREAEEALKEAEQGFRSLFASNPLPMWVYDLDTLQFLEVNHAAEHKYGYTRGEFLTMRITDIRPLEDVPKLMDELAERHQPLADSGTWRHRVKSGRIIHVEITSHTLSFAGRTAVLVAAVDVTERIKAEQALRETEERMRFALTASRVGIWETDAVSGVSRWSEVTETLHGLAPGTFGKTFQAFLDSIHPDDRQSTLQDIEAATRTQTDTNLLYRTVWPDSSIHWINTVGQSHFDEHGRRTRAAGVSFDVTERRALEEHNRQSQKMEALGQLAGGVAHDFNNVLTAILGYGNLALDQLREEDPIYADVAAILQAGESAATLTRQLLAFSRRQVMQPQVVNANTVVADTERLLGRLIGENIELVSRLQSQLSCMRVDPGQLEQVLMNLAVNARDAMPDGGQLTIETADVILDESFRTGQLVAVPGPYVLIAVSDTGTGMDADVQAHLFEPFFTTKPPGKGTGIGLATVYGIVKQSGGLIGVYSEPGRGTTFKIYLPASSDSRESAAPAPVGAVAGGSETILIVEDNPAARNLAQTVLRRLGYTVLSAPSGEEALEIMNVESESVHLVVTDIVMSGMTGVELSRRLAVACPNLRVLFTSGYSDDAVFRHRVLAEGVLFLQKPYTPAVLARAVREALDR